MRRFLAGLSLFCLLCGGGLMLVGTRHGAEREIRLTAADGTVYEASLFGAGGISLDWYAPDGRTEALDTGTAEQTGALTERTVSGLDLENAAGGITVRQGKDWAVELSGDGSYETVDGVLSVRTDLGDMTVTVPEGTALNWARVRSNLGDVTLEGLQTGELTVEQAGGEITMTGCTWETADIQCDLGSVKGERLRSGGLRLVSDAGEVHLQGELNGETDIESDLGSVKLELEAPETAYSGRLEADLGRVTAAGRDRGKLLTLGGGPDRLDVTCDMGDICVTFAAEHAGT